MAEVNDIVIEVVRIEVDKLELKAGDVLAIKLLRSMPAEYVERIKSVMENVLPDGVGVMAYPADEIELMVVKHE